MLLLDDVHVLLLLDDVQVLLLDDVQVLVLVLMMLQFFLQFY